MPSFYHITIHRAGPDVSLDEFRTNMTALAGEWLKLPQPQKLARSCDLIFMNNTMDAYVKAAGLPDPRPIYAGKVECETAESIMEFHKLPEMVEFFKHHEYHTDRDITSLIATADIKFEKPSTLASTNREHCVAILEVPEGQSPDDCEQRLDVLLDRFLERPVVQKNLLKLTLFRQDGSMNDILHEAGMSRFTKHTLIIHGEYANQQDLMETMNVAEPSLQQLIVEALKDFDTSRTTGFGADVVNLLEK